MKKFLSTILTLTMLALPLAAQCSALECSYDQYGNCRVEIPAEKNTNSDKKEEEGFLSKVCSFCLKTLLVVTVLAVGTTVVCAGSPNGEWVKNGRMYWRDTTKPWLTRAYKDSKNWISNTWIGYYWNKLKTSAEGKWKNAKQDWEKAKDKCLINGKQDEDCYLKFGNIINWYVQGINKNIGALFAKLPITDLSTKLPIRDLSICKDVILPKYFNATTDYPCSKYPQTLNCYCSNNKDKQSN